MQSNSIHSRSSSSSSGKTSQPVMSQRGVKRSFECVLASFSNKKPKNDSDLSVKEELECNICWDFAPSPIQACTNGHITCGICVDKLRDRVCSMCGAKLSLCNFGERLAKKLEVNLPCQNQAEGCRSLIKSTELKKHHTICKYRPLLCDQGNCAKVSVPLSNYAAHMAQTHHAAIDRGNRHSIPLVISTELHRGQTSVFQEIIINYDDAVFLWQGYQTRSEVYSWVELLGGKEECEGFWFFIQVGKYSGMGKVKFQFPVFPVHSVPKHNQRPVSDRFAIFPISLLRKLYPDQRLGDIVARFDIGLDKTFK